MKQKEFKQKGYKDKFGNAYLANKTHTHTRAHKMQSQRSPEKLFQFFRDCHSFKFLPNISNG
jgi:hypothetical protein